MNRYRKFVKKGVKETFSKKEPITDWEKTNTLDC